MTRPLVQNCWLRLRRRDTDERLLDEEISELLEPDAPEESIIGSDEDSADEVDDLLG